MSVVPAIVRGSMLRDDLQAVFPSFRTEEHDSFEDTQMARERFLSLVQKQEEQRKTEAAVFQNGKPIFTYLFIALQVLMFFVLEINGAAQIRRRWSLWSKGKQPDCTRRMVASSDTDRASHWHSAFSF